MMKSALIKDLYFEMDRLKQGILFFLETFNTALLLRTSEKYNMIISHPSMWVNLVLLK